MARKDALNVETLAALGAERLAALLMAVAEGDPAVRKRLVLAVAERGGREAIIKAVDRRLSALAGSRGYIDWEKTRAYAIELDDLREAVVQSLAPLDARAEADRLIAFLRVAPGVLDRVDDSRGDIGEVFHQTVADLGETWTRIGDYDPEVLAGEVLSLVRSDTHGVCSDIVEAAAPALGRPGLAALAERAHVDLSEDGAPSTREERWSQHLLARLLREIADAQNDVDAFIALATQDGERVDTLGIARRLLAAGRAEEALEWLSKDTGRPALRVATYADLVGVPGDGTPVGLDWEREMLRIEALDALGRRSEAQASRWRVLQRSLSVEVLRAHIRAAPDFEEEETLDRAFAIAAVHPNGLLALEFFVAWPRLTDAAKLVLARSSEIDGRHYTVLTPAAAALGHAHPLAATILYRKLIDSVLQRAASKAYAHAAADLASCGDLAGRIDWSVAALSSHADYCAALRAKHSRKAAFWAQVKGS